VEEGAGVEEAITIATGIGTHQTMLLLITVSQTCTATPTEGATLIRLTARGKRQVTTMVPQ
jgi:hypothetical protein